MTKKDPRKYISTPVAARLFQLDRTYAAKLAREAKARGNPFPIKRGKSWEAPEEEWAKIFDPPDRKVRKSRPLLRARKQSGNVSPDTGISCTKAARLYGISPSWASRLALRAKEKGYQYPKKNGHQWIAPMEEWTKIFEDPLLRAWKKDRNS